TLHGNKYLKTAMITAAMAAKSTKQTGLRDFYWRLCSRMGKQKANVALAHKLLRIIYVMIQTGATYQEYKKSQRTEDTLTPKI
ncbi:IS110 family transposase, partial [Loigolactobacillus coryniformis subsp. torquens]|nr:IS110 family transposase [Loigolactobacillus coryniformis subsp. torquens]MBW4806094.1 IS110 family transposase [Loigolactobacillus coryniformis subsp. torquens]